MPADADGGWSLNTLYFEFAAKRLLAVNAATKRLEDPATHNDNGIMNDAEDLSIPPGCYPQPLDVGLTSPPRPREPHDHQGEPRGARPGRRLVGRYGACWGADSGAVRDTGRRCWRRGVVGGEGHLGGPSSSNNAALHPLHSQLNSSRAVVIGVVVAVRLPCRAIGLTLKHQIACAVDSILPDAAI